MQCQHLYTGDEKQGTRPAFTADEIEKIHKAVDKVLHADYIYFMIYTGYRPSEMFALTKASYDAVKNRLMGGSKTEAGSDTGKASLIDHANATMTKHYQSADIESLKKITDVIEEDGTRK